MYQPNSNVNGEYFNVDEDVKDKRPFKALLDVGITRTTTGNRVFGALKGATDGGLNVPHKTKIFPGYTRAKTENITNKKGKAIDSERTEAKYDAKVHRARIYG
jgi:large subunit ribosomal protein L5e